MALTRSRRNYGALVEVADSIFSRTDFASAANKTRAALLYTKSPSSAKAEDSRGGSSIPSPAPRNTGSPAFAGDDGRNAVMLRKLPRIQFSRRPLLFSRALADKSRRHSGRVVGIQTLLAANARQFVATERNHQQTEECRHKEDSVSGGHWISPTISWPIICMIQATAKQTSPTPSIAQTSILDVISSTKLKTGPIAPADDRDLSRAAVFLACSGVSRSSEPYQNSGVRP
jgi:hypothetical protein